MVSWAFLRFSGRLRRLADRQGMSWNDPYKPTGGFLEDLWVDSNSFPTSCTKKVGFPFA